MKQLDGSAAQALRSIPSTNIHPPCFPPMLTNHMHSVRAVEHGPSLVQMGHARSCQVSRNTLTKDQHVLGPYSQLIRGLLHNRHIQRLWPVRPVHGRSAHSHRHRVHTL